MSNSAIPFLVVMYHFVHGPSGRFPRLHGLTEEEFAGQLDYLLEHHTPLGMDDLRRAHSGSAPLPSNGFLLTFDHGTKDHLDVALPLLGSRRLEGVFYVMTATLEDKRMPSTDKQRLIEASFDDDREFLERFLGRARRKLPALSASLTTDTSNVARAGDYLSEFGFYSLWDRFFRWLRDTVIPASITEQIVDEWFAEDIGVEAAVADELYLNWDDVLTLEREGMTIGTHGHDHLIYSKENLDACAADVETSISLLHRHVRRRSVDTFSYPNGGFNRKLASVFSGLGIEFCFSTQADICYSFEDRYAMNRLDATEFPMRADAPPGFHSRKVAGL
jgi:peptidoglycan/xylan/chitin deacetylase (PgdA/CDA1 family)